MHLQGFYVSLGVKLTRYVREPLNPYRIPEPVDAILPSELLSLPGFSEAVYMQDVFAIFSASPPSKSELEEMHKAWFNSRKPSVKELWDSRHPVHGGYQISTPGEILRKVCTLQNLLELASELALVQRLQTLLMDHIMLMCVTYGSWERPSHYFPDFREKFRSLVDTLGASSPPPSDRPLTSAIAPEIRAKIESFVVDPSTVTPLEAISGNDSGRNMIKRAVFLSTRLPHLGILSQGILLHGPRGTGKTLLALASAAESQKCKVYSVSFSDLVEQWLGSSEKNVAALFTIAEENAPAIIVIDEVERLCGSRQATSSNDGTMHRVTNTFSTYMTRAKRVTVIGTTKLPWYLDQAIGHRFPTKIHVTLPSKTDRVAIIERCLTKFHHGLTSKHISALAEYCNHFTGDDITQTIHAAVGALAGEIGVATHFRQISLGGRIMYCPCDAKRGDAMKCTFADLKKKGQSDQVTTSELTVQMLQNQADAFKAEIAASQAADQKHKRWASQVFYD